MSISDELIFKYALLLGNYSEETINQLKNEIIKNHLHPFEAKKDIAQTIIAQFWSKEAAEQSRKSFEAVFQEKNYEQTQPFYMPSDISHEMWIVELLKLIGAAQTSSQAKRLIEGKAVTVDNQLITEFQAKIKWHKGTIIKAGKHRIYKIM